MEFYLNNKITSLNRIIYIEYWNKINGLLGYREKIFERTFFIYLKSILI